MSLIASDDITLMIPVKTDEKDVVTEYRLVYMHNGRMESIPSSQMTEMGLTDTSGVNLYYIFKYGRVTDNSGNILRYINWKQYEKLDDVEKLKYWSLNDVNCIIIRGKATVSPDISLNKLSLDYNVYTIRNIGEQYRGGKIHHIEAVGV